MIRNSILWENQPSNVILGSGSISGGEPEADTLDVTASNIVGLTLAGFDPKFVDPAGDLRLTAESPAIDTADDGYAPIYDVVGHTRHDEPGVPACSASAPDCGSIADMGAYEFGN